MAFDLTPPVPLSGEPTQHRLPATPTTCFWGYIDRDQTPCLEIDSGDIVHVEAITHHAGDAPDLLMDDGIRAIWSAIAEDARGPGVHIMTGPIHVRGAAPGDTLAVRILDMTPRLPYGSNCAAYWGLLYSTFGKERITIYGLDDGMERGFDSTASPLFGFDFAARPIYDVPGVITEPDPEARQPFSRPVQVPVRPHFGVMGVAPAESGRHSSIPPGAFGGNVDNWRLGPGATMCYPVFVDGANLYVGDPHFAQGDGEICGTAIEASLDATIQVFLVKEMGVTAPVLETDTHWFTHGFGADLDEAMRGAAEQMLWLMGEHLGLSADDAYSLVSVAIDLGITQVVDGVLGCHAAIARRDHSVTVTPRDSRVLWSDHQSKTTMPDDIGDGGQVMSISRMNHAVLYVRDAATTERFYRDVLGFSTVVTHPEGAFAFMRAPGSDNHHDIAFFSVGNVGASEAGRRTVGLYHIAWEVPTLHDLRVMRDRLQQAGALVGASDHGANKSLYARDPDGLEFEVMWLVPPEHWGESEHEAIIEPLDLDAEIAHFAMVGLA